MKVVRWVLMFTGVTLLWSVLVVGGMLVFNDMSAEAAPEPVGTMEELRVRDAGPVVEHHLAIPDLPLPLPPPSTEMPRVHRVVHVDPRTPVQLAPGFYTACFGESTQERSTCRRLFNRVIPETDLMRRYRTETPGLADITKLVLGRVILSEVNWPHDEHLDHANPDDNHAEVDAPLIYQVLRHTRRRGETLLGAMRRHAPHVSEARPIPTPERHRRMIWVTELQLDCDRPAHFERTDAAGNPLNWERDYRPRCEALFALAQRLLDGDAEVVGPWTNAPLVTWGGRCETEEGACDDENGWARGLVPFDTGDTANRFWCRPGVDGCPVPPEVVEEPATAEVETTEVEAVGPVASEVELVAPAT